jgi:hypothetical protein
MESQRFNRKITITRHALIRMTERGISDSELLDIVDSGVTKYTDDTHLWVYKYFSNRNDNLVCAVLVLEHSVVIKTVMHYFSLVE